jgi:PAS domain S-box-containing protein
MDAFSTTTIRSPAVLTVRRYLMPVLLTSVALALGLAGRGTWGAAATYSFFLGAVMLTSWISGLRPGLIATFLGTVAADYFLVAPIHTITFDSSRLVQLSTFVAIAVLISSLNDARRRALAALAAERARLDHRVMQRTAELAAANESLRAEIERRTQSERNFRSLIDAAPDAILVIDSSGRVVKMNDEAERMFGYTRDHLIGRDIEAIVPERFHAAYHASRRQYQEAPTPPAIAAELTAKRADGTEFPVEIRIGPLDTPRTQSIVGIVRDITERQRLQSRQQQLVHDLGERVKELTVLHLTGRLLNEPGSADELLSRLVRQLPGAWQHPTIADARICVGTIDVRTDGFAVTPWMQRTEFQTSDGQPGTIEIAYHQSRPAADEGPFLAEERNLNRSLAGMLQAYFERLQAERDRVELARAEAERSRAEEDNAAKDQFLATLSHELRSPLNMMLGWTQMLRTGDVSREATARGFTVLERSVRLQTTLIDDLLDVSRIIAGKLRIEKTRIDLTSVAAAVVDAARLPALSKGVELTASIEPGLFLDGDAQRIQQIISNLLNNALKFTAEQGSIHVTVERIDASARIVVQDTGIGMSPALLARAFDRFQQGDASTTRTHGGLGLGLAIVKHLVERHEGQIVASSDGEGRGSTFTVTLPLLPDATLAEVAPPPLKLDRSLLSGVRVLVVDDETDTRMMLGTILERFGAHATVVASAREALDEIGRRLPDVLLSDIAMPNENGYALIRRIRATITADSLPAAAVSAYVDGDSRTQALDAGFQTYLSKPVEPALLATTVATLIHRASLDPLM